jgi:hypothetical protein
MEMAASGENHGHELKRIVLPSGKTIEVVYFPGATDEAAEAAALEAAAAADAPTEDLHHCRECDSGLVYPVEWEEAGPEHWQVDLRCPNCEWTCAGVFPQDVVEEFDEELDRGTEVLTEDYKRLVTANMAEDVERFVSALDVDAILPEDF